MVAAKAESIRNWQNSINDTNRTDPNWDRDIQPRDDGNEN